MKLTNTRVITVSPIVPCSHLQLVKYQIVGSVFRQTKDGEGLLELIDKVFYEGTALLLETGKTTHMRLLDGVLEDLRKNTKLTVHDVSHQQGTFISLTLDLESLIEADIPLPDT